MIIESVAEANMMCREELERNLTTSSIVLSNDHAMSIHTFAQNQLSRNTTCSTAAATSLNNNNEFIVGIVFVQDGWNTELKPSEVSIGTMILKDLFELNARILRGKITELCLFDMNENFIFLTNFGSPVSIEQEPIIKINHLVTAEKTIKFKRKLGSNALSLIGYYSNNSGIFIGILNASLSLDLKTTRNLIDDHLRKSTMRNFQFDSNYYFMVHGSCCIINTNNEPDMVLIDIIKNSCVSIKFDKPSPRNSDSIYFSNQDKLEFKKSVDVNPSSSSEFYQVDQKSFKKGLYRKKTLKLSKSIKIANKKQIMISYVRREAAEHALQLKESLIDCGFSVYLDVHEIQHGSDWQDSLNSAVQNCLYFIPLITQNYGRTQWTNREVKLADILQKHIIPVNFLDIWPPECLAIQFSSVHYIPWNAKTNDHEAGNPETASLDDNNHSGKTHHCIRDVTLMIEEKINKINKTNPMSTQNYGDSRSKSSDIGQKDSERSCEQQNQQLIVISAHPAQIGASQKIKEFLSKHFDVWCTNEMTDDINELERKNESLDSITSRQESIELITSPTKNYARQIAEKSKKRPKSMPSSEKLAIKKRELQRVQTYGDSPCFPSISPEKKERLKLFETQASKASLIIILASNQYYNSKTSEEHVFYCGQRKKMILVQYDKSSPPVSISRQITLDNHLEYSRNTFENDLLARIKRTLDPTIRSVENFQDHKITWLVDLGKKHLGNLETCVYILGSTETADLDVRTVEICEAIGREFAKIPNLTIVTNNSFGASDIVAFRFHEELKNLKFDDQNSHPRIIHIAPISENEKQKTYGHTLLLPGLTPKDRDPVMARMLNTSVLIGGDQNSAKGVEDIFWNDHFVIPIKSTGGAAAGEYKVPEKIFTCPSGVKETDWAILSETDAKPDAVAVALVNVIHDLKKAIYNHATYQNLTDLPETLADVPHKRRVAKRRNHRNVTELEEDKMEAASIGDVPLTHGKYLPTYTQCSSSSSSLSSAPLAPGHSPNIMASDEMDGRNGKKRSFLKNVQKIFKRFTTFN